MSTQDWEPLNYIIQHKKKKKYLPAENKSLDSHLVSIHQLRTWEFLGTTGLVNSPGPLMVETHDKQ